MTRRARNPFPVVTAALVAALVATFGLELASGDVQGFCTRFGFDPSHPSFTAALTSLFLHASLVHLAGNLVVLAIAGTLVERSIGSARFALLFFAGGLCGAALHCGVDSSILVGCSASLFAVLAVASVLFGLPALAFTVVLALVNIAHAFGAAGAEGVSFAAHCGGLAAGALVVVLARLRGVELRAVAA